MVDAVILQRARLRREQADEVESRVAERKKSLNLPEENLLYFLEKNSLVLEPWQREILRIVRIIAQYFYPQRQTQVMNEGCATFVHYTIMNTLFDRDRIGEGTMLEILRNHSNVIFQPAYDDPRYSGINPYALGLDMMQDIRRIATEPTAEDRDRLIAVVEDVEDIPGAALHEGVTWAWETFPEYLDAIDNLPRAIDIAAQVPHCAVRTYVMGERGTHNQPATAEDIARMAQIEQNFTALKTQLETTPASNYTARPLSTGANAAQLSDF